MGEERRMGGRERGKEDEGRGIAREGRGRMRGEGGVRLGEVRCLGLQSAVLFTDAASRYGHNT